MAECKIKLGDLVQDRITGLKGIVIVRSEWLNSCWRVSIVPETLKDDGTSHEMSTFDEPQLKLLEEGYYFKKHPDLEKSDVLDRDNGGPSIHPQGRKDQITR